MINCTRNGKERKVQLSGTINELSEESADIIKCVHEYIKKSDPKAAKSYLNAISLWVLMLKGKEDCPRKSK